MTSKAPRRSGFSLLEVLLALAIFLIGLVAVSQLLNICADNAIQVQRLNRATLLLQSQMNRAISGEVPFTGQGDTPFDEDPDWSWSLEAEADSVPNLWHVTISVSHTGADGSKTDTWSLRQTVLDPAARGVLESTSTASSSGSGSGGGTTNSGGK